MATPVHGVAGGGALLGAGADVVGAGVEVVGCGVDVLGAGVALGAGVEGVGAGAEDIGVGLVVTGVGADEIGAGLDVVGAGADVLGVGVVVVLVVVTRTGIALIKPTLTGSGMAAIVAAAVLIGAIAPAVLVEATGVAGDAMFALRGCGAIARAVADVAWVAPPL